jgi:acetoin utilization protein AcuB
MEGAMRVAERMRRDPIAVGPGESLGLAGRLLARHRVDALPVVRRSALVGLLAAVDVDRAHPSVATTLAVREIPARLDRVRIDRVIRPAVTSVGRRTPLVDAIRLMRARRLPALPVTEGERLLGLLTEDDLLALLATFLEEPTTLPRAAG